MSETTNLITLSFPKNGEISEEANDALNLLAMAGAVDQGEYDRKHYEEAVKFYSEKWGWNFD